MLSNEDAIIVVRYYILSILCNVFFKQQSWYLKYLTLSAFNKNINY